MISFDTVFQLSCTVFKHMKGSTIIPVSFVSSLLADTLFYPAFKVAIITQLKQLFISINSYIIINSKSAILTPNTLG